MPNGFLFGEDFPSVASKQAELSHSLAKNLSNVQKHKNKVFNNLGSPRTGNDLRPQVTSLSTSQTDQKTIGPFAPARAPQTKTQQLLRVVKGNNFRPRTLVSGYQNTFHSVPVQLHIPVPKCSDLTVLLVDVEVNKLLSIGVIKAIPFSKENFYSRLFLVPKKEGIYCLVIDLSRLNRFVENFHFQMENISCLKTL